MVKRKCHGVIVHCITTKRTTTRYKARSSPSRDCLRCYYLLFCSPNCHSEPKFRAYCRGVNPTSKEVYISNRGFTDSQLGDWSTCFRPDLNPGPSAWEASVKPLHHPADKMYGTLPINTPRVRGYVFVLVALASHEKLDLLYSYWVSATHFSDFSLKKILITFRNVRALPGTNSYLSRTFTCRATLISETVLINRTLQWRQRFVVLWKNKVKNQNSKMDPAQKNPSGNS